MAQQKQATRKPPPPPARTTYKYGDMVKVRVGDKLVDAMILGPAGFDHGILGKQWVTSTKEGALLAFEKEMLTP